MKISSIYLLDVSPRARPVHGEMEHRLSHSRSIEPATVLSEFGYGAIAAKANF